jgi:hypothetical protein
MSKNINESGEEAAMAMKERKYRRKAAAWRKEENGEMAAKNKMKMKIRKWQKENGEMAAWRQ